MATKDTRRPLKTIAGKWAKILGFVSGGVALLVNFGIITADQGGSLGDLVTSLEGLGALVAGVIAAGGAVIAAFRTGKDGEKQVTPLSDPRDHLGRRLEVRE